MKEHYYLMIFSRGQLLVRCKNEDGSKRLYIPFVKRKKSETEPDIFARLINAYKILKINLTFDIQLHSYSKENQIYKMITIINPYIALRKEDEYIFVDPYNVFIKELSLVLGFLRDALFARLDLYNYIRISSDEVEWFKLCLSKRGHFYNTTYLRRITRTGHVLRHQIRNSKQ